MTTYLKPEQKDALAKLSKKTGRPMQEFLREGVDMVLKKYSKRPKR